MPRDVPHDPSHRHNDNEETEALLSDSLHGDGHDRPPLRPIPPRIAPANRRQSSFSKPPPNGQPRTPRTPNRVRFDLDNGERSEAFTNGHIDTSASQASRWIEDEDDPSSPSPGAERSSTGQRAPLLTNIEAPSVTVANTDLSFDINDLLESARPKSGMRSAFMNMANSIM